MFPNIDYSKRKPKPINYNTVLQLRTTTEFKNKLLQASQKMNMSISDIIREAINKYLQEENEL